MECSNTLENKRFSDCIEPREALRNAQGRLHNILNAMDEGVTLVELDGRVLDCNEASLKLLGFTKEEFIGKNVYDIVVPEDKQRAMQGDQKVLETGKHFTEVKVLKKNGSTFNAEISVTALNDKKGKPTIFLGVVRDISERKKSEEMLCQREELYRTVFDNSDDGFILTEPIYDENGRAIDFRFSDVNLAYERQTGRKRTVVVGKRAKEIEPNLEPDWILLIAKVAKTGKSTRYENYNQRTKKWYDANYFPYAKGQVGIFFRDVTERKKAAEALKQSEEQIRVEEHRLSLVYDNVSEILYSLSVEPNNRFRFTSVNQSFLDATGLHQNQVVNRSIDEVIPEPSLTLVLEKINQAIKEKKTVRWEEVTIYPKGKKYGEVTVAPLFDSSGRCINLIGNVHDITERKNLENQLKDQERLATIGATAGMVGHDIRNPLQAIAGDLFLIDNDVASLNESEVKASLQESVKSIQDNLHYIAKIVEDLQDYARPLKPNIERIKIDKLIEEVMLLMTSATPNHQVTIDVEKGFPEIVTDFSMLKRALTNLTQNAIQAMPNGGQLIIQACRKEAKVFIAVEDTGEGIPEEIKPKLFTPMVTTKSKGQGLGLAVVKRLVESLNGKVSFESELGKGTRFLIELPISMKN